MKHFNIFFQYFSLLKQILVLEGYSRIERSKNEMEKQINKL